MNVVHVVTKEVGAVHSTDEHALDHVERERVVIVADDADSGIVALNSVDRQVVEVGEEERNEEVRRTPEQGRKPKFRREEGEKIGELDRVTV